MLLTTVLATPVASLRGCWSVKSCPEELGRLRTRYRLFSIPCEEGMGRWIRTSLSLQPYTFRYVGSSFANADTSSFIAEHRIFWDLHYSLTVLKVVYAKHIS
ncbi:hypothetical protein BDN70DRAFT_366275 [Pholiota conissans]|uniref:Secreted protein n=1 Tax=Pholiota conissans TaxID=109636 RepID=A0A9P6D062_9AGAR|nr:hypothetical protein BDN70DRAFT_366275 [Pholiota conissans]